MSPLGRSESSQILKRVECLRMLVLLLCKRLKGLPTPVNEWLLAQVLDISDIC